jgi:hypothetical protein
MTPQRRSQMQAHARQKQRAVMDQHADDAARKFVDSVSPEEVRLLRRMLTRIDARPAASGSSGEGELDIGDVRTIDGKGLKDALWELSAQLGSASPELKQALGLPRKEKGGRSDGPRGGRGKPSVVT